MVDPSTEFGQGEGSYHLTLKGKPVWSGKRPHTFWRAAVADDGTAAGVACDDGPGGSPGKFRVVIFAPDGSTRLDEVVERKASRLLHVSPHPVSPGMFIDSDQRRLVVRVISDDQEVQDRGESWWVYDLTNGRTLAKVRLPLTEKGFCGVLNAAPVRATPLVLLSWWYYDTDAAMAARKSGGAEQEPGSGFTLIDLSDTRQPKPIWTKLLPGDFDGPVREQVWRDGVILRCDQPSRFAVRYAAEDKRVTFEVVPPDATHGWQVLEVGREALDSGMLRP